MAALRFALAHPLVEADAGLGGDAHHTALTAAARAKRRDKPARLAPLGAAATATAAAAAATLDPRALKVLTVEGVLDRMRARLTALEGALTSQLAALPANLTGAEAGAEGGGGVGGLMLEEEEEEEGGSIPSPNRPASPFRVVGALGGRDDDDDRSDMSPLPDDVMDAIENSDPSDDDVIYDDESVATSATGTPRLRSHAGHSGSGADDGRGGAGRRRSARLHSGMSGRTGSAGSLPGSSLRPPAVAPGAAPGPAAAQAARAGGWAGVSGQQVQGGSGGGVGLAAGALGYS